MHVAQKRSHVPGAWARLKSFRGTIGSLGRILPFQLYNNYKYRRCHSPRPVTALISDLAFEICIHFPKMGLSLHFLSALQLVSIVSSVTAVPSGPLLPHSTTFGAVKEQTYDYVIVGGGLTGLVVANRLSEDPSSRIPTKPQTVSVV